VIPIAAKRHNGDLPDLGPVLARRITILGSTGSIGVSTLDVVAHSRAVYGADVLPIAALTAQTNVAQLAEQARRFRPRLAVIADERLHSELKEALAGTGIETAAGRKAVIAAAALPSDVVMVAIMGAAAIEPALAAIRRSATVALANKECVVAAGAVFRDALMKSNAAVIPVDSEHNAVFQVLSGGDAGDVERVTLTASGGPFREWALEKMRAATPEQAVAHPNWSMGAKISVDSATLMNKGLELIEAHFLFALEPERLGVLVHPQSVVHCLVTYEDGSTLAHLSAPDMRTPIAYAIAWPRRINSPSRKLDLAALGQLQFQAPAHDRFPCLNLAFDCLRMGGLAPTILNAANEIAVDAFLCGRIGFLDIPRVVEETVENGVREGRNEAPTELDGVLHIDARSRRAAGDICGRLSA
jgi:1-deoxy-D-xylulose-5-phosphate reductoisomerase